MNHNHAEAFMLMNYACRDPECQHHEIIWNSRDGVTPFGMNCPSCGGNELIHCNWKLDKYAPDHKPHAGQRVWIDLTPERALVHAQRQIAHARIKGYKYNSDAQELADNMFAPGMPPDIRIEGYNAK
jgi:hypothetical protein